MAFSADDFIVKIALQVDDSQLKQAMKDIDALGLSSHNKASSRAANQNSEFVGPPQRVRQHAYNSSTEREGQGKDNLRNKRIRVQTALDFLRWPGIIAAGVTSISYPLLKLYQLTERNYADLLNALKGISEKGVGANLSERDVQIAEKINPLASLPKGTVLQGLTRVAQINSDLINPSTTVGAHSTVGMGESRGFSIGPTLQSEGAIDQIRALRMAVKGLTKQEAKSYADQYGFSTAFIGWLNTTSTADFNKQLNRGIGNTLADEDLQLLKKANLARNIYLEEKKSREERIAVSKAPEQILRDEADTRAYENAELSIVGTADAWIKTVDTGLNYFVERFFDYLLDKALSVTETSRERHYQSREEERNVREKRQPISMTLNVNGQLKDGTMTFTEELMANNTQTFIADIDGTA